MATALSSPLSIGKTLRRTGRPSRLSHTISSSSSVAADFCGSEGQVLQRPSLEGTRNGKKYHIHTFGCQMNLADSERMAGSLDAAGYEHVANPDVADVLIYNTCSIREKAEDKVYSAMGSQVKRKRQSMQDLKIIVAGCMAKQAGETLLRRVPEVDIIMGRALNSSPVTQANARAVAGPHYANRIEDLLDQADQGSQVVATDEIEIDEDISKPRRSSDITAWVNVIYGCNERCTYCVVPNARGQEQSRSPDAIKREMIQLGQQGYKEVTLLGQNVDAYGRDLPGMASDGSGRRAWCFTDLLRYVHDVPGIERIRFATSHPRYFTERLIEACSELPKLSQFFHIPFQSGNNAILRDMRRGYTHERYRDIIHNIRRRMPNASISGDAIVGFPGETEEQFQDTMQLVRDVGFDRVNTAAYSARPRTPAAVREDQVADLIKMDRLNRLNRVVMDVASQRAQRFGEQTLEVLVEGVNPKKSDQARGRTEHNKIVFFNGDGVTLKGKFVMVKIQDVKAYTLYGTMIPLS